MLNRIEKAGLIGPAFVMKRREIFSRRTQALAE
jgi:hypothetical protein